VLPVTVSEPSAFFVALVRCKKVCEAAKASHAEVVVALAVGVTLAVAVTSLGVRVTVVVAA
jgi:hypothetical protein